MDSAKFLRQEKYSFYFKELWLGLIPLGNHQGFVLLLLLLTISYFLNQKLWVVNLTDSQGLGMQEQIQGTDELQMWTGLKEFGSFLGCQVLAFLIITIIIVITYLSGICK